MLLTKYDKEFKRLLKYLYIPDDFRFDCKKCGDCCRHEPGFVWIFDKDISRIASYLEMSEDDFLSKHCINKGGIFSIKEKSNYDCLFWDKDVMGGGCSIYEARPAQCRNFPYWVSLFLSENNIKKESERCPGLYSGDTIIPKKEIIKRLKIDFIDRYDFYIKVFNDLIAD